MSKINEILASAANRARQSGLGYAGAVLPAEAQVLRESGGAIIVDVRSRAELDFDASGNAADEIELKSWPGMKPNPD